MDIFRGIVLPAAPFYHSLSPPQSSETKQYRRQKIYLRSKLCSKTENIGWLSSLDTALLPLSVSPTPISRRASVVPILQFSKEGMVKSFVQFRLVLKAYVLYSKK